MQGGRSFTTKIATLFDSGRTCKTYLQPILECYSKKPNMLSIKWPKLPSEKEHWEGSPLSYIGHLIGYEGEGSLYGELVR